MNRYEYESDDIGKVSILHDPYTGTCHLFTHEQGSLYRGHARHALASWKEWNLLASWALIAEGTAALKQFASLENQKAEIRS